MCKNVLFLPLFNTKLWDQKRNRNKWDFDDSSPFDETEFVALILLPTLKLCWWYRFFVLPGWGWVGRIHTSEFLACLSYCILANHVNTYNAFFIIILFFWKDLYTYTVAIDNLIGGTKNEFQVNAAPCDKYLYHNNVFFWKEIAACFSLHFIDWNCQLSILVLYPFISWTCILTSTGQVCSVLRLR